jgi:hypothetical protein
VTRGTRPKKPSSSRGFACKARGAREARESWGLKTKHFYNYFSGFFGASAPRPRGRISPSAMRADVRTVNFTVGRPFRHPCPPGVRAPKVFAPLLRCSPPPKHLDLPQAFAPPLSMRAPRCYLRQNLPHLCPVNLLEVLPWKSTSLLPMPCQPTVLTGGKM